MITLRYITPESRNYECHESHECVKEVSWYFWYKFQVNTINTTNINMKYQRWEKMTSPGLQGTKIVQG